MTSPHDDVTEPIPRLTTVLPYEQPPVDVRAEFARFVAMLDALGYVPVKRELLERLRCEDFSYTQLVEQFLHASQQASTLLPHPSQAYDYIDIFPPYGRAPAHLDALIATRFPFRSGDSQLPYNHSHGCVRLVLADPALSRRQRAWLRKEQARGLVGRVDGPHVSRG